MRAAESAATAPRGRRRVRTGARQEGGSGVNTSLTPKTPREAGEVAAGAARMVKALARRAEAGDILALACLVDLGKLVDLEALRAAHGLSVQHGYSWSEIGLSVGISKQAAHRRWGER